MNKSKENTNEAIIIIIGVISLMAILSICSDKPSLELITSRVTITDNKDKAGLIGITEGEKKGQELVPTVLYYEFTIKNVGNKKIGGTVDKGLIVRIEPNDSLVATCESIIGFNIYNPEAYMNSGLGYGQSSVSMLNSGEEGKYTFTYDLGVNEENPETSMITPSQEKLTELSDIALDAFLTVIYEDKEIARYNLNTK